MSVHLNEWNINCLKWIGDYINWDIYIVSIAMQTLSIINILSDDLFKFIRSTIIMCGIHNAGTSHIDIGILTCSDQVLCLVR